MVGCLGASVADICVCTHSQLAHVDIFLMGAWRQVGHCLECSCGKFKWNKVVL